MTEPRRIADHTFVSGVCGCGVRWLHAKTATEDDIGKAGFQCGSVLTRDGYESIQEAKKAWEDNFAAVMGWPVVKEEPVPPDAAWRPGAPLKIYDDPWHDFW